MPSLVPPVPVPSGQTLLWLFPTTDTSYAPSLGGCPNCFGTWCAQAGADSSLDGGEIFMSGSCSVNWGAAYLEWSGFSLPSLLPEGTTVESIYPAVYVDNGYIKNVSNTLIPLVNGTPTYPNVISGISGAYSGQFTSGDTSSLGDSSEVIPEIAIQWQLAQSYSGDGYPDFANISAVALAVYVIIPPGSIKNPVISVSVGNTQALS